MILARTGNDARVLGSISSAAGIGVLRGQSIVSTWGSFRGRIHGVLLGMVGAGISKTIFGLRQMPLVWIPAQFCSSLNFPLKGISSTAIWLAKVAPEVQGPLADYVMEPAMGPGGSVAPILGGVFGKGSGAGMAVIYTGAAICLLLVGGGGYAFPWLRNVERLVPDHDAADTELKPKT